MKIAVVRTGGKQYLVKEKAKIKIEKIKTEEGKSFNFDEVLLIVDQESKKTELGNPVIKGAKVTAKVIKHAKDKKIVVAKYKAKTRYDKRVGHRQNYTQIEIESIG